ncbi:outer membrane protein assembly factor BamB family protein [Symbioplanes lichenis]|uniref:outer membrane protein assembly factor BamB family protein n=1 Tax=Symbioplanes lichenis TaxID=1629072 RepID=UPI002739F711|nr:PQQ-binding-like beta-propeller repeat protein [Actinoplanes lichenis]
MPVIELGQLGAEDETPVAPRRRRRLTTGVRGLLAAALAVAVLAVVTASGPPREPAIGPLWRLPGNDASAVRLLLGDALYVLRARHLTAYDARTGRIRWQATQPDERMWLIPSAPGVLLVATTGAPRSEDPDAFEYARATIALDTATGRQLWRQPGEASYQPYEGRTLLLERTPDGQAVAAVRSAAVGDGRLLWSRTAPTSTGWPVVFVDSPVSDRVVTMTGEGSAEILDSADGHVVSRGQLPWRPVRDNDTLLNILIVGHTVLVAARAADGPHAWAYDTETLRQTWTTRLTGSLTGCAPAVCVYDLQETIGVDPRTGNQLWRRSGTTNPLSFADTLVLADQDNAAPRVLLDSRTGREIAELRSATTITLDPADGIPYLIESADITAPAVVTRVDPATGQRHVLGRIGTVVPDSCRTEGPLMTCQSPTELLILAPGELRAG